MSLHTISAVLLVFCCGRPFTDAKKIFEVKEGEDLRFKCSFYSTGSWMFFCRNRCETWEDYLIISIFDDRKLGRYSVERQKNPSNEDGFYVSIKNVQSSDAGEYSCWLRTFNRGQMYSVIDVIIYVNNAVSSGSATGVSASGASEPQQDHTPQSDVALYVGLTLSALVILSVVFTLLHWRKRASTPREPPQTPGYAGILEVSSDSRQSSGASVQMSSTSFSNITHSCDAYSQ